MTTDADLDAVRARAFAQAVGRYGPTPWWGGPRPLMTADRYEWAPFDPAPWRALREAALPGYRRPSCRA